MTWELTEELSDKILRQLESGIGLRHICEAEGMPSLQSVFRWKRNNTNDFGTKYALAREAAGELAAYDLEDINTLVASGRMDPSVAQVISTNKKWAASKLCSKVYGDKQQVEHSGKMTLAQLVESSYKLADDRSKLAAPVTATYVETPAQ